MDPRADLDIYFSDFGSSATIAELTGAVKPATVLFDAHSISEMGVLTDRPQITITESDLAGVDLSGAILANATFREVDLSDSCLAEARLDGSDFRYATLSAANLGGANLGVAALRHAKLNLSNLEGAVLRGTDLSGASLSGARTAGADFKGAVMMGADLRDADLSRVENLTQAQVDKTICDKATKLPPGVFRPLAEGERLA
jgi:uncharacterized protein YjbI with pentapeptide repeats